VAKLTHTRMGSAACVLLDPAGDDELRAELATLARRPRGGVTRQSDNVYWVQSAEVLAAVMEKI
jgi:hypothetical protein